INDFKYSKKSNKIEKKIYELKNNKLDIFENDNDFVIYNIENIQEKKPNIDDEETRNEIIKLVTQKNKFDYNRGLLEQIKNKKFDNNNFLELGNNNIKTITLNSVKDNNKFDINSVEMLYSLPVNTFTLINDENNNIYLTKIKSFKNKVVDKESKDFKSYIDKESSNNRNSILKSYDLFLTSKYDVIVNQKTIERVKNFFQ
ncbi:SurA, partial [Candidatus Pelagibacter sp.]|nr:SurA [Candidatus Pelagibacter sp.]